MIEWNPTHPQSADPTPVVRTRMIIPQGNRTEGLRSKRSYQLSVNYTPGNLQGYLNFLSDIFLKDIALPPHRFP